MRDLFEVYLNNACDFLWSQFEKDLEFSERIIAHAQTLFEALRNAFLFRE
jgi:hypothetical protein